MLSNETKGQFKNGWEWFFGFLIPQIILASKNIVGI